MLTDEENMVLVGQNTLRTLLSHAPINFLQDIPVPSTVNDWYVHEKAYSSYLNGLINLQISTAHEEIQDSTHSQRKKASFGDSLDDKLIKNVRDSRNQIHDLVTNLYKHNKARTSVAYKFEEIMDAADNHALKYLRNYNFDLITNMDDDLRSNIRRQLWEGTLKKETPAKISNRLMKIITEPMPIVRKSDGKVIRIMSPELRAFAIARTESSRIVNQGAIIALQQYGAQEIGISAITDTRICPVCKQNAIKSPYPINLAPYLPVHPFCRCRYIMVNVPGAVKMPEYNPLTSYMNLVTQGFELID